MIGFYISAAWSSEERISLIARLLGKRKCGRCDIRGRDRLDETVWLVSSAPATFLEAARWEIFREIGGQA